MKETSSRKNNQLTGGSDDPEEIEWYLRGSSTHPFLICGDALTVLTTFPAESVDCCMTSPPYWGHRQYAATGIGLEPDPTSYIEHLVAILSDVKRVLKPSGSLWLNIGDTYVSKCLAGIPWRVALTLIDKQGWVLRNSVLWNKVKGGPDNARDKLRNVHEDVFHFVKSPTGYFYDVDAIRSSPKTAKVINGAVVSATGVSGVRYKRQIERSTALTPREKTEAMAALEQLLEDVRAGKLADFRMIIRGQQRTTHSDSERVSGRARELTERGFYFLKYHPNGSKPGDVWDIIPEDTQGRDGHYAPYPQDLCRIPILATCPRNGVVLDPFCGTGTTMLVALKLGRKSVGIDLSTEYLRCAADRCNMLL
ncbi:MAG: site-specific DNA-methyltransferase [Candidatus Binatia bacterium]